MRVSGGHQPPVFECRRSPDRGLTPPARPNLPLGVKNGVSFFRGTKQKALKPISSLQQNKKDANFDAYYEVEPALIAKRHNPP
jgi:hypothetical protein